MIDAVPDPHVPDIELFRDVPLGIFRLPVLDILFLCVGEETIHTQGEAILCHTKLDRASAGDVRPIFE